MKTNQIFNIKRFINLIKSDILINYKKYLMQLGIFIIAVFALFYINLPKSIYRSPYTIKQFSELFNVALVALVIFAGFSFTAFSNKKTTRTYLLTPASALEKYISEILGKIIVPTLLLLIVFWVDANLSRWIIIHTAETTPSIDVFSYASALEYLKPYKFMTLMMVLLPLSFGMYFFSTRLFFGKNGFIKSALVLSVVFFMAVLIFGVFNKIYFPEHRFFSIQLGNYETFKSFSNNDLYVITLTSVAWIFFTITGFFKLKEKEL